MLRLKLVNSDIKVFYVVLALSAVLADQALADPSNAGHCYAITDSDYRAFCRAKMHHQSGYSYTIQRQDLRSKCLANVH